jgi:hypothetical protein
MAHYPRRDNSRTFTKALPLASAFLGESVSTPRAGLDRAGCPNRLPEPTSLCDARRDSHGGVEKQGPYHAWGSQEKVSAARVSPVKTGQLFSIARSATERRHAGQFSLHR